MSNRVIEVVDYDLNWLQQFENEKLLLAEALGVNAMKIEHIGSTSVSGLAAKPIIDILIEVTSLSELDAANKKLEDLGYEVKGENGISGRRYFHKGGHQRTHHIHAFKTNDPNLVRHLAFKKYLIAHPTVASEYDALKRKAASKCNNNSHVYVAFKNDFIKKHEKFAIEYFNHS